MAVGTGQKIALLLAYASLVLGAGLFYQRQGDSCVDMTLSSCNQCTVEYEGYNSTAYYHCQSEEGVLSVDCWSDYECDDDNGGTSFIEHIPTQHCSMMQQCEIAMNTVFILQVEAMDGLTISFLDSFDSVMNQTSTSVTVFGEVGKLAFTNSGTKHPLMVLRVDEDSTYLTSHGECLMGEWCTFGPFRVQLTSQRLSVSGDAQPFALANGEAKTLMEQANAFGMDSTVAAGEELIVLEFGRISIRLWRVSQPTVLQCSRSAMAMPLSKLEGLVVERPLLQPVSGIPAFGNFLSFSDFVYSNGQLNATLTGGPFNAESFQANCQATDNAHIAATCDIFVLE